MIYEIQINFCSSNLLGNFNRVNLGELSIFLSKFNLIDKLSKTSCHTESEVT